MQIPRGVDLMSATTGLGLRPAVRGTNAAPRPSLNLSPTQLSISTLPFSAQVLMQCCRHYSFPSSTRHCITASLTPVAYFSPQQSTMVIVWQGKSGMIDASRAEVFLDVFYLLDMKALNVISRWVITSLWLCGLRFQCHCLIYHHRRWSSNLYIACSPVSLPTSFFFIPLWQQNDMKTNDISQMVIF